MIKVKRNNVILRINEVDKQHYLDKGFSVIDDHGQVVESGRKNIAMLEVEIRRLTRENAELKELVKRLRARKNSKSE